MYHSATHVIKQSNMVVLSVEKFCPVLDGLFYVPESEQHLAQSVCIFRDPNNPDISDRYGYEVRCYVEECPQSESGYPLFASGKHIPKYCNDHIVTLWEEIGRPNCPPPMRDTVVSSAVFQ